MTEQDYRAFICADDEELAIWGDPSPKSDGPDLIPIEHEAAYVDLWMQLCRQKLLESWGL